MFGKCKTCEVLKQENTYLRKFIDSLLVKLNMQKIEVPAEEVSVVPEEIDKLGPHAEKYGSLD